MRKLEGIVFQLKKKFNTKKENMASHSNRWKSLMKEVIFEIHEVKEIGGLREEIFNLMEENLKLSGTVKALNLEVI